MSSARLHDPFFSCSSGCFGAFAGDLRPLPWVCCALFVGKNERRPLQTSGPRQILPKPVERLPPAFRSPARCIGFKRIGLLHGDFGIAALFRKLHRGPNLMPRFVVDGSLKRNALGLNDLR